MTESSQEPQIVEEGTYNGKNFVKVLRIHREGIVHYIKEFEVCVNLILMSHKDFKEGDSSDVIATDSQKNTVYALAKTKGIRSAEHFGQDISQHFLDTYPMVGRVQVHIEEAPWKRIDHSGREHNHAFILSHHATRFADVFQTRNSSADVWSGLKNMKILKTTQTGFVGFVRDRFTSQPDVKDRLLSTIVDGKWLYSNTLGVNLDKTWDTVKDTILDVFAGEPIHGEYSRSVQNTLYIIMKQVLKKIPQVERMDMEMDNMHYFSADLAKIGMENNDEVIAPIDKPYGLFRGSVKRPPKSNL